VTRRTTAFVLVGLLVALLLAGVVSFYASGSPDGLERVASDRGLDAAEQPSRAEESPLSGYRTDGIGDDRIAGGIAGVVGVVATFTVGTGLAMALRRRGDDPDGRVSDRAPASEVDTGPAR
jgi:cobalt/nickel transport system permease protein